MKSLSKKENSKKLSTQKKDEVKTIKPLQEIHQSQVAQPILPINKDSKNEDKLNIPQMKIKDDESKHSKHKKAKEHHHHTGHTHTQKKAMKPHENPPMGYPKYRFENHIMIKVY